jgi:hypothetical protein
MGDGQAFFIEGRHRAVAMVPGMRIVRVIVAAHGGTARSPSRRLGHTS